jgi:N-acetylglucosamine-6-phosphate deacetylase
MSHRLAILNGTVVTPNEIIERGAVLCEDGKIKFVGAASDAAAEPNSTVIDATGKLVLPGFIDTHVHGSGGDDVMLDGADGIRRAGRRQLKYGTTAWLPSTVCARHEELLQAIENTLDAERDTEPSAEILGLHAEGPYINIKFKGAQPVEGIRDPDFGECSQLLEAAPGKIKIMTIAPELPGGLEMIRWLTEKGVVASLGHSAADYDTALAAIEAGATHATHLYNAMSGLHHRMPGLAAACLNEPAIRAELICDGVHVHPQMARLAGRAKGRDGIVLITDACTAQGEPDGIYALGPHQVQVRGALCTLMDGVTIASSVLTMNYAVMNAVQFGALSLIDAAYSAAMMPAKVCGVDDRKGSLEVGKDADVAILNSDYSVSATVKAGEVAYRSAA